MPFFMRTKSCKRFIKCRFVLYLIAAFVTPYFCEYLKRDFDETSCPVLYCLWQLGVSLLLWVRYNTFGTQSLFLFSRCNTSIVSRQYLVRFYACSPALIPTCLCSLSHEKSTCNASAFFSYIRLAASYIAFGGDIRRAAGAISLLPQVKYHAEQSGISRQPIVRRLLWIYR